MIDKNFYTSTKIVGVTQFNDNKYPIQMILPNLDSNDKLFFLRDYRNKYDENAIKVYVFKNKESKHIGYISKELAAEISPFLDDNPTFDLYGKINEITGGIDGKSYGCNVDIWIQDPNEPSYWEIEAFQEWLATQKDGIPKAETSHTTNSYTAYNKNQKKTNTTFWISFAVSLICLAIPLSLWGIYKVANGGAIAPTGGDLLKIDDSLITLNEYEMLNIGMSRSDVYNIVGSFGEKTSESGTVTGGYHIEMYSYEGYGEIGANAQLMFTNGKLESMAQFGLEKYSSNWDIDEIENNISIDDFEISYSLAPVDILGYYDIEATCNNKSDYNIYSIIINANINGSSEEVPIFCSDIIEAGEVSETFSSLRQNTSPINNYEILDISIEIKSSEGNFYYFEYDYKTKQCKIF